jgi:hypothetical protein
MSETGITNIRGKEYQTVALRVTKFREAYPLHALTTSIVSRDADTVVMQAQVADETGVIKATGHAEENRNASQINKTSALENCETSAIGRALAAFGFGGTEFATANEVVNAIHQQNTPANDSPPTKRAEKWEGAYSGKSALHKGMTQVDRNIRGCGDSDELEAYLATKEFQDFKWSCEKYSPHYLTGGDPAPPEFVGINDLIAKMRSDFELIENNPFRGG